MLTQRTNDRGRRHLAVGLVASLVLGAAPAMAGAPKAPPLRIAAFVPSGPSGLQSSQVANGAEIAVSQITAKGGIRKSIPITFTRVPLRGGLSAAAAVRRLAPGTAAVILPCNDDRQAALADAASRRGVVALAPCNMYSTDAIPSLVWPVGPRPVEQAAQLVSFIASQRGGRYPNVFILRSGRKSAYESSMVAALRAAAATSKMKIVGEGSVRSDGRDATTAASAIRKSGAEAVLSTIGAPYAETVVPKLRSAGYDRQIYATDGVDAMVARRGYGSSMNELYFVTYGFPRPAAKRFLSQYRARFKFRPRGSFPGLGFETIRVLEAAVSESRSALPKKIDQALGNGLAVQGVALGDAVYVGDGRRQPVRTIGVAGVLNRQYVPLLSSRPADASVPE
jgi:ABC-type branched-subunit amino acid transport system substrate-binding protein